MKRSLVLFAVAIAIAVTGSADAHLFGENGEGNPWFLPAVRDDVIPTIDGDLSDWAFWPDEYTFTPENWPAVGQWNEEEAANTTKDDFDVIVYGPAWIPSTSEIIWAAHKVDDYFYGPDECYCMGWAEDNMQIAIDADHGGDEFGADDIANNVLNRGLQYQQNYLMPKHGGIHGVFVDHRGLDYAYAPPWAFFEFSRRDWVEGGDGSYDIEHRFTAFTSLSNNGIDDAVVHTFQPGDIIGLSVDITDYDADGERQGDVDLDYGNISFGGDQLGDFYLLSVEETQDLYKDVPTAVENASWGRVKAALGK